MLSSNCISFNTVGIQLYINIYTGGIFTFITFGMAGVGLGEAGGDELLEVLHLGIAAAVHHTL